MEQFRFFMGREYGTETIYISHSLSNNELPIGFHNRLLQSKFNPWSNPCKQSCFITMDIPCIKQKNAYF